ncbi:hypothetical protein [uncultured Subdoligranulum sp.]|uniref:hypothetical protein n=1 Tax=uncultured Subdoligranulum sp. TaxID=512298 RepID=UPI00320B4FD3
MKIEQFCQSLKEYLSQFSVVRILMPLAAIILYVCGALYALNALISLGSLVMALAFWLGIVMAVLVLAQCQFLSLAIGFALYALYELISFLSSLIQFRYVSYGALVYLVCYGLLAFLSYRKSLSLH